MLRMCRKSARAVHKSRITFQLYERDCTRTEFEQGGLLDDLKKALACRRVDLGLAPAARQIPLDGWQAARFSRCASFSSTTLAFRIAASEVHRIHLGGCRSKIAL